MGKGTDCAAATCRLPYWQYCSRIKHPLSLCLGLSSEHESENEMFFFFTKIITHERAAEVEEESTVPDGVLDEAH